MRLRYEPDPCPDEASELDLLSLTVAADVRPWQSVVCRLMAATDRRRAIRFAVDEKIPAGVGLDAIPFNAAYVPQYHEVVISCTPTGVVHWAVLLHEVGHAHDPSIIGYGLTNETVIRGEVWAWRFALHHAPVWLPECHRALKAGLNSYRGKHGHVTSSDRLIDEMILESYQRLAMGQQEG
jgi:hypothetical protein